MNRRQRKRNARRRAQHAQVTRKPDRPALMVSGAKLPVVNDAHIVPRMYQRAWEGDGRRVVVHRVEQNRGELRSTKRVGTRPAFYRRTRPQGIEIDDFEASLGGVERRATKPLRELIAGEDLTFERKGAVAQLLGVQMTRSPAFFGALRANAEKVIAELGPEDFKPAYLRSVSGDVERARGDVKAIYGQKTFTLGKMVSHAMRVANVLAHMRWYILRFEEPLLAYSDQPVTLWPMGTTRSKAFRRPHLNPIGALEVRAPLAPDVAILMNWIPASDCGAVAMGRYAAGDLNAFTVGQADEEWMHKPGYEPEVPDDIFAPLSRLIDPTYDRAAALRSLRRIRAKKTLERIQSRTWVNAVEVVTDVGLNRRAA
jgi:hypothetical protein